MKKKHISINLLFFLIVLVIFSLVSIGSLIIAKRGVNTVFVTQMQKFFSQNLIHTQRLFDQKHADVHTALDVIKVPQNLIASTFDSSFKLYLQEQINSYLDFLIFIPNNQDEPMITEGVFLYDISSLEKYLQTQKNSLATKEIAVVSSNNETSKLVFLLSSKKIIAKQSGRVIGTLVGGVELSFASTFFNDIKTLTQVDDVVLLYNNRLLDTQKVRKQTDMLAANIFQDKTINITQNRDILFNGEKSGLQISMTTSSEGFDTLYYQLKQDVKFVSIIFIIAVVFLLFIVKILLISPLIRLRNYAQALIKNQEDTLTPPSMYVYEYQNLSLWLHQIFQQLLKSQSSKEKQYNDLLLAKEKIDESMETIDKYVIVTSTDVEGTITKVSSAFEKISGYSKNYLIGKNHRIMKSPLMSDEVYSELWATISNGKVWRGEMCNIAKDGTYYWTYNIITPIYENSSLIGYTAIREDITNKKRLEEISIKDPLTSLYNRRKIEESLNKAKLYFDRFKEEFSILLIDIDHFKQVNDTFGHQCGDDVLRVLASLLVKNSRKTDEVARWGGEEFMIFMPRTTLQQALYVAEKIRDYIEKYNFQTAGKITVSIGVAEFNSSIDETINRADVALYRAKELGRNQTQVAN